MIMLIHITIQLIDTETIGRDLTEEIDLVIMATEITWLQGVIPWKDLMEETIEKDLVQVLLQFVV